MENLTISDPPPPHAQQTGAGGPPLGPQMAMGGRGGPPPPQQQLPPQMFTTAAQLLDLTDKKLIVALRDGRKLMGILRSWDQFANLVLQSTVERIYVPPSSTSSSSSPSPTAVAEGTSAKAPAEAQPTAPSATRGLYADITHGIFLVRGENVLLLGEIDLDKDDDPPPGYEKADIDVVKRLAKERRQAEKLKEKGRIKKLGTMGFEGENMGEILL